MPREYRKLTVDDYEITKNGDVINKKTGRKVKPQVNGRGYYRISIGKKLMFIHRLVAEKYIPNPDNKPQVNHIDGNKLNNRVENLEWVSNQENHYHAIKNGLLKRGEECSWAKLSKMQVDFIREHSEIDSKEMAKVFGVSDSHVREIRRNESWRC